MELQKKHFLYIFVAILLILCAAFFYFQDSATTKGEIPFIRAAKGPVRVKPDPDSEITSSKYNPIYDQIKSQKYNTSSVQLRPYPEKPVKIESADEDNITQIISGKVSDQEEKIVTQPGTKKLVVVSEEANTERESRIRKTKRHIYAQVASTRNKDDAEKEFKRIRKNHSKLLFGFGHRIEKFDIQNKGRYYNLLVGPIESTGKAQLVCKKLISSGISCIIKKL